MTIFYFLFFVCLKDGGVSNMANKKERDFQADLIKELGREFKGSIVTKLDSGHIQGIPDLLILHKDKWATLECKAKKGAKKQNNQPYYVDKMNKMSFLFHNNNDMIVNMLKKKVCGMLLSFFLHI